MEWSVLFLGSVAAGKTCAIRSISDIDVVDTDAAASDATAVLKSRTTVAMDVGVLHLSDQDKLRVYGAPGQDRFDFMWDILLMQCKGAAIFVNHADPDPVADLAHYLSAVEQRLHGRAIPLVVAVTHVDRNPQGSIERYRALLRQRPCRCAVTAPPVFPIDARSPAQVRGLLAALTSLLEMAQRFGAAQRTEPAA